MEVVAVLRGNLRSVVDEVAAMSALCVEVSLVHRVSIPPCLGKRPEDGVQADQRAQ